MLVRLLYASRSNQTLKPEVIDAILAKSREYNPAKGITGILCFSGDIFMQVLEGGRDAVSELYAQICSDARHRGVTLLHYEEIAEREFAGWTMGQVNMEKINPCILLKYSETSGLNPFNCSGAASMALLKELIATASIVGRAQ
ncbi:BLUF domain-containing protein [Chitinimonas sp.]|uniref:BLUF domain-containing protein n=1 Tax=Chitinimonas sp. TaxID=1934313 RepID=UPI0035B1CE46